MMMWNSLPNGDRRAAAAAAPSPCALERKPSPVPGEGRKAGIILPAGSRAVMDAALPVRDGAGSGELNLCRSGRGGEPEGAGRGAEPKPLRTAVGAA
jgi:hypothetical protein